MMNMANKNMTTTPTNDLSNVLITGLFTISLSSSRSGLLHLGRCSERMVWGRCRHRPLQSFGAFPGFGFGDPLARHNGMNHIIEEQYLGCAVDEGTDAGDHVPVGKLQGVVGVAAGHAGKTQEVLREERDVEADEGDPELELAHGLAVHPARPLGQPRSEERRVGKEGSSGGSA